jgi:hypothetical protein
MTAPGSDYSHSAHIRQVTNAAQAAGIKGAAIAVLAYLCHSADFKKPTVRRSKANMVEKTGYCLNAVKAALRTLREAGFIEAIQYATGGRERATVYVLRAGKGAINQPPLETAEDDKGGQKMVVKGAKKWSQRGPENRPPSLDYSYDSSRVKGPRFARGGADQALDAGRRASTGLAGPDAEEMRRFSADVTKHGYGEARRLQIARQAERSQGL